jgi:RNA polymerase sigma-70 factor (ECF subfamily)
VKNEIAIEGIKDPPDGRDDPERRYHRTEMARDLTKLLAPRELECVRLRAEGLKYEEIADVLDLRQGTVGATLARAHRKIRRALGLNQELKVPPVPRACTPVREENSYSS